MLEKGEGKINEIVYEHTAYRGGKYQLFPTIDGLKELMDELIQAKATAEYLRITPFYVNEKANLQREFDELMFFMECKDFITEEEELAGVLERLDDNPLMDLPTGKALRPMCRFDDPKKFGRSLRVYQDFLNTSLPQLFAVAKEELKLQEKDLAFGYFCFEVHSK
jgi:hypothetical protein